MGEAGLLQERLAAHAGDPRNDWIYEAIFWSGPRVMSEVVRLVLQRRIVDELMLGGRIGRVVGHYPERATASVYDTVAADTILRDVRLLASLASPGLLPDIAPVLEPISARTTLLPRGVDPNGTTWSTHEMAYAGARARASMLGQETVLLPGSTIVAESRGLSKWIAARRAELIGKGVLVRHADARLLLLRTLVKFRTAQEAVAFVTGGAAASARLTWLPVDDP